MITSVDTLRHSLAPCIKRNISLLGPAEAVVHIEEHMLETYQSCFAGIRNRLGWCTRLRHGSLMTWKGIPVNQGMAGSTSLDLSQSNQIATFEIAIAVLEFPKRRVG